MKREHVDVIVTAIRVAQSAPKRQANYTTNAGVDWRLIHQLRRDLAAAGLDWETGRQFDTPEAAQDAATAKGKGES